MMKELNKLYLVGILERKRQTNIGVDIAFDWADGMVGAMPVFRNKKTAMKYAGKRPIYKMEVEERNDTTTRRR